MAVSGKRASVLLVDDDVDQLHVLGTLLQAHDFSVIATESAPKALNLARQENVDILITDIAMPALNGLELAREVRSSDQTRHLPVVLLTAGTEVVDFSAVSFKADAVLLKHDISRKLITTIKSLVSS